MAFSSWTEPETITAICAGIGTLIGAIATFICKIKGKTWKEVVTNIHTEDLKTIADIAKKEINTVKKLVEEKDKEHHSKSKKV